MWYYFPLITYKKRAFFLLYYVLFAVQSESEIRFWQSNIEIRFFLVFFYVFFFGFVCLIRIG